MSKAIAIQKIKPSPTLSTILMVEDVIKNAKSSIISIPEIKRSLPKQVNHNTLKTILEYLEESGKIVVTLKGITWVQNMSPKLRESVSRGRQL